MTPARPIQRITKGIKVSQNSRNRFAQSARPFTPHSSAREYYLLMRARGQTDAGGGATDYADYRRRKKAELDREYADYSREKQARFDRDFDAWREKRGGPPRSADEPARQEMTASQHDAERS